MSKRVYLDNCCYNRPYDDQNQLRISLETQAKLEIQRMIRDGSIELVTSYMTRFENNENPIDLRRNNIASFQDEHAAVYVEESAKDRVLVIAGAIEQSGVKPKDAFHVACAILSECDCFLTTDDRLLKYKDERIKIMSPIEFINEEEA